MTPCRRRASCRTDPEAPFAQAAYAQMKYESAYLDWVDAVNDATEVCTIGHALWVHNLALYQAHYATITSTTNDLKAICAEEGAYDGEVPEDGTGTRPTPSRTASSSTCPRRSRTRRRVSSLLPSIITSGRKLVWWQQLCEPTISAMEALCRSLEVETPQLQCFAETCQRKKATEEVAFDELVKAHNKFEIVFGKYTDEVHQYNDMISQKNTAPPRPSRRTSPSIPSSRACRQQYDKDTCVNFEKFDSGADKGRCGLSDCQVGAICSHKYQNDFEFWVDTEKCEATPRDAKMCHLLPLLLLPPSPCRRRPCRRTSPRGSRRGGVSLLRGGAPDRNTPESEESRDEESVGDRDRPRRLGSRPKITFRRRRRSSRTPSSSSLWLSVAEEAQQAVLDLKQQLTDAKAAASQLTGPAAMEALKAVQELKKQLADAETEAWEANEAVETIKREVVAAKDAHEDAVEKAKEAKVLVKAINNLVAAEKAVEKSAEKVRKLKEEREDSGCQRRVRKAPEGGGRRSPGALPRPQLWLLRRGDRDCGEEARGSHRCVREGFHAAVDAVADRALELAVELKNAIDEHGANEKTVAVVELRLSR